MLLDTLRAKMVDGANFAEAFELYFDEVADDPKILELGKPARHKLVEMAIAELVGMALKGKVVLTELRMARIAEVGFMHGVFSAKKASGFFFYFEEVHMGIAAIKAPDQGNNILYS
ncbi:MAG TPA: hypothetical protein VFJ58_26240, partial [Armatimonadota bacterium]|nr:hypothetical protein [Armatimonadota bacterium]